MVRNINPQKSETQKPGPVKFPTMTKMWTEIWELQPLGTFMACAGLYRDFFFFFYFFIFPFFNALCKGYPGIKDSKWVRGEGKSLL
jgi:hypothetical protein